MYEIYDQTMLFVCARAILYNDISDTTILYNDISDTTILYNDISDTTSKIPLFLSNC